MSDGLARFLVNEHLDNLNHQDKVLNLTLEKSQLLGKVIDLEAIIEQGNEIIDHSAEVTALADESHVLTKKELRREKRKAVGVWFKNNYQKILFGLGGFGLGVGVGFGVR